MALLLVGQDSITQLVLDPSQITDVVVSQASAFLLLLTIMQPTEILGATRGSVCLKSEQIVDIVSY